MKNILCVEDNEEIQILVGAALEQYQVTIASDLKSAAVELDKKKFDLIILDLGLPDGDGMKFLAKLNGPGGTAKTPIFILTANADVGNKVIAFSIGADDFIVKPFDPLELRARVSAKLKKSEDEKGAKEVIRCSDLLIDVPKQRVYLENRSEKKSITLTSLEFRILVTLAQSPDRVFSRSKLLDRVWGENVNVTDRTVDTHVGHLRKKVADSKVKIETVLNEGYRLII